MFALYLVAEGSGVLVKLPGEISLDQSTGQLTARFGEDPVTKQLLPQLPFSELEMKFFGGPGASLVTPSACGRYTTTTSMAPWSGGVPATPQSSSFSISSGCASGFSPSLVAGTMSNLAGSFSPLTVSFSRQDGEQELHAVQLSLPPGLLGEVAHVERCGEAQANAGTCGPASEIGTVSAATGAGPEPFWVTDGHAYLTGPYDGQPFGLSIVVPAVAGPFNLGPEGRPIVVRSAISVNPVTAGVTITSEPFPRILEGVPLQIRTIVVDANRPDFTLNPTSCAPMSTTGTMQGTQGASAALSASYQAAGCADLPFKPSFTVSTQSRASKADGASLTAKVTYPAPPVGSDQASAQANIGSFKVELPKQLPSRLTTLQKACVERVFEANPAACPVASAIGSVKVRTPVLSAPVEGPVYLVSHGGEAFPNLVMVLQGEGVVVDVVGSIFVSKNGITSVTLKTVPDVPFSSFELKTPEGPYSALTANVPEKDKYNLCGQTLVMPTTMTGQNYAVIKQSTKIAATGCPKARTKKKKKTKKARGARTVGSRKETDRRVR